ncbi:MAG: Arc family DNA-binding protein [Thermoflexibacter sp.]
MAKKKSFALRIDGDLMEAIEQWAADEFRSTNGQIEWMLYQMLKQTKRLKRKMQEIENEQEKAIVNDNQNTESNEE